MKRLLLYALVLALVWVVPVDKADVSKLRPVELIAVYKINELVVMATDTEDMGVGATAEEALANMRSTSPALIYLDTAEYLIFEESATGEVESLRDELKDSVRLCYVRGPVDLKITADFLPVHGKLPAMRKWKPGMELPELYTENDRLKISQNEEKVLDNSAPIC